MVLVSYTYTVDFRYSGHGYSGHFAGAGFFSTISILNKPLIVAICFGYRGYMSSMIIHETLFCIHMIVFKSDQNRKQ